MKTVALAKKCADMRKVGISVIRIAEIINRSRAYVYVLLNIARALAEHRHMSTRVDKEELLKLRALNMTHAEIAKETGFHIATVSKHLKGVKRPKRTHKDCAGECGQFLPLSHFSAGNRLCKVCLAAVRRRAYHERKKKERNQ